jgi:hypothetical protein
MAPLAHRASDWRDTISDLDGDFGRLTTFRETSDVCRPCFASRSSPRRTKTFRQPRDWNNRSKSPLVKLSIARHESPRELALGETCAQKQPGRRNSANPVSPELHVWDGRAYLAAKGAVT